MNLKPFSTLVLITLSTAPLHAAPPPKPSDYDKKGDGLDFDEFFLFQRDTRKPLYSEVDLNGDGQVDEAEKKAFCGLDWQAAHLPPTATTMSDAQAAETIPEAKPKSWGPKYLHLRKDHESLSKPIDKADAASFGYYRNNISKDDTWAVEATLGLVIPWVDRDRIAQVGNYDLVDFNTVASSTLNRITGTGAGDLEIADSLVFRAGLSWQLQRRSLNALWDYQVFNVDYRAEGSSGGGDFKSAGEFEWEPSRSRKGEWLSINGALHQPFENESIPFDYRLTFASRLEFGEDQTANSFFKLGPKVGILVIPRFLPDLSLFANYTYLWEAADGQADFDYLETGARWQLDQAGQVSLEAKYRYGLLPAKYTDIDVFQLALSVKF